MRLSGGICLECRRVGSDISGSAVGNTGNSMNSVLVRIPALIGGVLCVGTYIMRL